MRFFAITLFLISFCIPAVAFETEAEKLFEVENGTDTLRIISTVDMELFVPLIDGFQELNPTTSIEYSVAASSELFKAIEGGAQFDLAISSAMDLQTKLANDGHAQAYRSDFTQSLPDWAHWSDRLFAFTQEPAVLIISKTRFEGLTLPENHRDLIQLLLENPDIFSGKIGTYDPHKSGLGYLFATQDTRMSEGFWRLVQVMGSLDVDVYCCSGDMITGIEIGELALAYNVLGSYAASRIEPDSNAKIVQLQDYTHVMLRTALIPANAKNSARGGAFIDFLLSETGRNIIKNDVGLPPIDGAQLLAEQSLRPIRLGPGLLVYLDKIKRERFLRSWTAAIQQ